MSSNNEPCISAPGRHRTHGQAEGQPCALHAGAARPARPGRPCSRGPTSVQRPGVGLQVPGMGAALPRTKQGQCKHAVHAGCTPARHRRK